LNGTPHAASGSVPDVVKECARRLKQRFYSIDVIERADGELRVVEVGDGQVSDLAGWEAKAFAGILKEHFLDSEPA
jgi:glutathione synthase/RimK-type ligase-like ATP-grasp enzyme